MAYLWVGPTVTGAVGIQDASMPVRAAVDFFRNLNVSIRTVLLDNNATPTLDTQAWATTLTGSGAVTTATGAYVLTTGTTANSRALLASTRKARTIGGTTNIFSVALVLGDSGVANNTRRWGVGDAVNGVFFELAGTTLQGMYRVNSVDTAFSFNIIPGTAVGSGLWEIGYAQGGFIMLKDGVTIHAQPVTSPVVWTTPHHKLYFENINSGGSTTNVTMSVLSTAVARMGDAVMRPRFVNISATGTTVVRQGAGTLHRVVVNTDGSGANDLFIYDNTAASGTPIAIIHGGNGSFGSLEFNLDVDNGITVASVGGTSPNVTIVYS